MSKSIKLLLIVAIFISLSNLITGCTSCTLSENKNISATKEVSRKTEFYGLKVHYNITVNVKNIGNNLARFLTIDVFYCNNLRSWHDCHNQTYFIGDLSPNSTVQRYLEYDVDAIRDNMPSDYSLQYYAKSC